VVEPAASRPRRHHSPVVEPSRLSGGTSRSRGSRAAALVVALLATLLATMFVLATSASAHATVDSTSPADGSRLQTAPELVSVTFDESVGLGGPAYLTVTNTSGQRVDTGGAYHPNGDGRTIAVKLKPGLGNDTYTASYRVVSADSHPVAGVVRFVVGNGPLVTTAGTVATVNHDTSVALDVAHWISYAGVALLGGAWLLLTIWRRGRDDGRARRVIALGWVLAVLGAVFELLLEGPYVAGTGLTHVFTWSLLDNTLHSGYGLWHSTRILLLGLLAVAWRGRRDTERVDWLEELTWLLLGGVVVTFSMVGHAKTTSPLWVSITADALHVAAMATWAGGLAMLLAAILPRRDRDELHAILPVFSRVALGCVAVLGATGLYAAIRGVGMWRALFTTEYGLLVCLKVLLFGVLIVLGYVGRSTVQRIAGGAGDTASFERVRRTVSVEVSVVTLVLIATAVLVGQPRGREAVAINDAKPVSAVAELTNGRSAEVTVEPGKHGTVTVTIALTRGAQPQAITATATQQSKQIGPIPLDLKADGTNRYQASDVDLPVSGHWTFHLVVTNSATDAVSTDATVRLH
jgi:copper transport protein